MSTAQAGLPVMVAGVARRLAWNPVGHCWGPHYEDAAPGEKAIRTPRHASPAVAPRESDEVLDQRVEVAWGEAQKIAARSENASTIFSYTGATHCLLTMTLRVAWQRLYRADAHIAELEARIAEIEAAGHKTLADYFKGSWTPAPYEKGSLVQKSNGVWLALVDTGPKEAPGNSPAWRRLTT